MDKEELKAIKNYHQKWLQRARVLMTQEEIDSLIDECTHNRVMSFESFKAAIIKKENN